MKNVVVEIGRITEPDKQIHVIIITQIIEDEKIVSSTNQRYVCAPDHADITDQPQEVQDRANLLWTQEVKDNYAASLVEKIND